MLHPSLVVLRVISATGIDRFVSGNCYWNSSVDENAVIDTMHAHIRTLNTNIYHLWWVLTFFRS